MGTDIREAMAIAKKQIEARKIDEKRNEEALRKNREIDERFKLTFRNVVWHYLHDTEGIAQLLLADIITFAMLLWCTRLLLHLLDIWPIVR